MTWPVLTTGPVWKAVSEAAAQAEGSAVLHSLGAHRAVPVIYRAGGSVSPAWRAPRASRGTLGQLDTVTVIPQHGSASGLDAQHSPSSFPGNHSRNCSPKAWAPDFGVLGVGPAMCSSYWAVDDPGQAAGEGMPLRFETQGEGGELKWKHQPHIRFHHARAKPGTPGRGTFVQRTLQIWPSPPPHRWPGPPGHQLFSASIQDLRVGPGRGLR